MKTYPGIDYSGGRSNIDPLTGLHFGVISQNSVHPEALDDIMTHGRDLAYEEALEAAYEEARVAAAERGDSDDIDEDQIADHLGNNWETNINNYLYEQDGYKLTGCLDNDLMIFRSPYYTNAQFCSPCVPGAGNLDNPCEDGPKTFCLGHDWFDGKAPYPVYSVATGLPVLPEVVDKA